MINGKKVAGILLEVELDDNKIDFVVMGIGINLNTDLNLLPSELRHNSTSIFNELNQTVDYCAFLKHLFLRLDEDYSKFINQDINSILSEWKKHSNTIGKNVRISTSSEEIIGKASDIDESGFLIITTDSGEQKKIKSGDCFYIKQK
jgi:BirA family biotin operon repressor/biotin-[acetyl-CoA-carboxylase] ligase